MGISSRLAVPNTKAPIAPRLTTQLPKSLITSCTGLQIIPMKIASTMVDAAVIIGTKRLPAKKPSHSGILIL
ncbi:hypothetical protein D3C80_1935890 [compost metagenome]